MQSARPQHKPVMKGTKCNSCTVRDLSQSTVGIKLMFFIVLELVIHRFDASMVTPQQVLEILPEDISSKFEEKGKTIQDIFKKRGPLMQAVKWFELSLLILLVEKLGDQTCKRELESYITLLRKYLESRTQIVHEASTATSPCDVPYSCSNQTPLVTIQVDPEWDESLVKDGGDEGGYLSMLLGTTPNKIQFTS